MSGTTFLSVYNLANLTAPASGVTHGAKWQIVALASVPVTLNMLSQMEFLGVFLGQSMQVDNSANATDLVITETTYGWTRTVAAGGLQTFQYPAVANQNFIFTSSGDVLVTVSIFDWPAFPDDAGSISNNSGTAVVSGTVSIDPQPIEVQIDPNPSVPQPGLASEIVSAGTAVTVFANTTADGAYIVNPNGAPGSLFVDEVNVADTASPGTNGTTVELVAGQSQSFLPISGQVTANSLNNGHTFVAVCRG